MSEDNKTGKNIPEVAKRALREAEERREKSARQKKTRPKEFNGTDGPEPTRFGDWEKKGIVSDF